MKERKNPKKHLLFIGLTAIAIAIALSILLFSLRYDELWIWYAKARNDLVEIENYILSLDKVWQFLAAVMVLFSIKSFFPIYATSTVCFLSGVVLPSYIAIPVNVLGFTVLITIRYFTGKRFGAGGAWKMISKTEKLRNLIEQDGKGNPALLIALRLLPAMPVNSISGIYGSLDFGYGKFVALSVIGFMPKLISFTLVGRNVYDPLSAGFLLPIIIILFLTGLSLLSVNGVWATAEKTVELTKKHKERKIRNDQNK